MTAFFNRFFSKRQSRDIAKERLKLVLMGDRGISPALLERVKEDILRVLSAYMEIDPAELEIKLTETENEEQTAVVPALVASIPIRKTGQLVS
ncbi:MAG: cell division topological specificity factor MinE [Ruminococcaceae bacterium]|nr:cell division topological specificity factor MinE [Oscillospiraceae bacterium]